LLATNFEIGSLAVALVSYRTKHGWVKKLDLISEKVGARSQQAIISFASVALHNPAILIIHKSLFSIVVSVILAITVPSKQNISNCLMGIDLSPYFSIFHATVLLLTVLAVLTCGNVQLESYY
jgi:hypothetical protein